MLRRSPLRLKSRTRASDAVWSESRQSNFDNLRCIAISLPGVLGHTVVRGVVVAIAVHRRKLWCMRFYYIIVHLVLAFSYSCSPARRSSSWRSNVFERVLQLVVLAHVVLSPPLGGDVLHHHLAHVGLHEATDEPRVPELGGDPQVLAAAHEGVGLAALGRGGDAVGVEVLLFATSEGNEAAMDQLAGGCCVDIIECAYRPPQTRPYSLVTNLPVTIVSPLGARPQPPGPKALFNMRLYLISGK